MGIYVKNKKKKVRSLWVALICVCAICITSTNVLTLVQAEPENAVACVTTGGSTEYYDSISSAVSGWTDGSTLKLLKSVSGQISTTGGTKTLDLNGYNISKSGAAVVANGTNLTVMNSASTASKISNTSSGSGSAIEIKNGHLYLYDVTVESRFNGISLDTSSADIYSGTISVTSQWKTCLNVGGPGKAIIHGGTFRSANHMAIYLAGGGEAEIEDGSFKGGFSAAVVVKGGYFDRNVTSLCADGYQCVASNDTSKGAYMIKKAHSHDGIVFEEWTSTTSLPATAGNYYLANDITIGSTWNVPSGTTNLCLSGHNITYTGSTGSVFTLNSGATLNLYDCDTTEHYYYIDSDYVGVVVESQEAAQAGNPDRNGSFTGGYITGGKGAWTDNDYRGGGIFVTGGSVNLYGGTLIGNNAKANVGGIYCRAGSVSIHDGAAVIGNTCQGEGGGILIQSQGTLTMDGGEISNNTTSDGGHGGGISVVGKATITGGKITGNLDLGANGGGGISSLAAPGNLTIGGSVEISGNRAEGFGGGIYAVGWGWMNGSVSVSGSPKITDNTANHSGSSAVNDNVYITTTNNSYYTSGQEFMISGALGSEAEIGITVEGDTGVFTSGLSGNGTVDRFTSDNDSYEIRINNVGEAEVRAKPVASVSVGDVTNNYGDINSAINAWKNGGKLTLLKDTSYNSIINIRPMYGYSASEYTLDLNGKTFSIQSIQVGLNNSPNTLRTGPHLTIEDSKTGGVLRFSESGMIDYGGLIELRGGTLTGGNGTWGGLFLLHIYASLDMYDGVTLTGNTSTYGGAVLVGSDSEFNMYGGKISGNSASDSGGGVVLFDNDAARFNMYGGEISGNRASKGGGVSVNVGSFHICGSNAIIKDNVASGSWNGETATYTGGTPNNVYLPNGKKINIDSELSSAPIGVTLQNGSGIFTTGLSGNGTAANFTADNSSYEVRLVNGEAYVGLPHTHNWVYTADGNVLTATCSGVAEGCCDIDSQTLTISAEGKTYDGTPVTASLAYSDGWTADNGLTAPEIVYSGNTDAGTHSASITLGDQTASASFTIAEKSMADEISVSGYTGNYDGTAHSITVQVPSGATVKYGTQSGAYPLDANPTYTDAGTYTVYYQVTRKNYVTVTGSATAVISPIDATVTITGNTDTFDYDGTEHTVTGYTAVADTSLYDVEKDFTFSGTAEVKRTDAGTTAMGLAASQFANENPNFATVTFIVTDGSVTVDTVDAVILTAPQAVNPIYNDSARQLISAGAVDGGTLYYALGADPKNAPDDTVYSTAIPSAAATGSYYIWYKVAADSNHNDLAPASLKSVVRGEDWVTLNGTLQHSNSQTPVVDALITLIKGDQEVDYVYTDSDGNYRFIVPAGIYNIAATYDGITETKMVELYADKEQDLAMSGSKTESRIKVNAGEDTSFGVVIGGLDQEALSIRNADRIPDDMSLSLLMTVEAKTEKTATHAKSIQALARNKSVTFFDIKLEKTVDSVTTELNETTNVLEIAVPYAKTAKRGVAVYSSNGTNVQTLKESNSKESGTFRVDKEKGMVYIYSNRVSTFAIGYTPYYRVKSSVSLGSFKGNATVVIRSEDSALLFKLENVALDQISFPDIPKGEYTMTVTWEDGATNTLTMPLTVS